MDRDAEDQRDGDHAELSTSALDGCPIQSPDALSLTASNGLGGKRGLDIWASTRASTGDPWDAPRLPGTRGQLDTPPFFSAANADDDRLPAKERVVFVERGEQAVAVPFPVLQERKALRVEVGGHRLVVRWRAGVASALDDWDVAGGRDVG